MSTTYLDHTDFAHGIRRRWAAGFWEVPPDKQLLKDPWVLAARKYQRLQGGGRTRQDYPSDLLPIHEAVQLYRSDEPENRVLVEAYLLTQAPHERIAEATQLSASTIAAYHALFFDVAELLQASDALTSFLFAGRQRHALSVDDQELWVKLYAVRGGVIALECVRSYFRRRDQWKYASVELSPEDQALRRRDEWVHLAILSECVSVTQENAAAWLFLAARMEELRQPTPESGTGALHIPSEVVQVLETLLQQQRSSAQQDARRAS